MRIGRTDLPGTTSCLEVFRFLPGWPFQNLLLSPALEDNSDGGVDLATRDSSDPSHAFLFPGLARRTEVGFVATLTLESEPIQAEDGDDRELEVLRVPVFGNGD